MKLGYYGGTWDVLHVGHINALTAARSLCDSLVVGVATDEAYRAIRGREPARAWEDRMAVVRALRFVDAVMAYSTEEPLEIYLKYKYDVLFISDEYCVQQKKDTVLKGIIETGVDIIYLPRTPEISSSQIKANIQRKSVPSYGFIPEYA